MKTTLRVTNMTMGRVEVPGRRAPLGYMEYHDYLNSIPEKIAYLQGQRVVTVQEVKVKRVPRKSAENATAIKPESETKSKPPKKKDSDS